MKEFIDYAKSIGIKSIDIDTLCLISTFLKKQESKQSSLNGVVKQSELLSDENTPKYGTNVLKYLDSKGIKDNPRIIDSSGQATDFYLQDLLEDYTKQLTLTDVSISTDY